MQKLIIYLFLIFIVCITTFVKLSGFNPDLYFPTKYITSERDRLNNISTVKELENYYYSHIERAPRDNRSRIYFKAYLKLYNQYLEENKSREAFQLSKFEFDNNRNDVRVISNYLDQMTMLGNRDSTAILFNDILKRMYDNNIIWRKYFTFIKNDSVKLIKAKSEYLDYYSSKDFELILNDKTSLYANTFEISDTIQAFFSVFRPVKKLVFVPNKYSNNTQFKFATATMDNIEYKLAKEEYLEEREKVNFTLIFPKEKIIKNIIEIKFRSIEKK